MELWMACWLVWCIPGREELDDVVRDAGAVWSLFCHSNWRCVDWRLWLQSEKLNFISTSCVVGSFSKAWIRAEPHAVDGVPIWKAARFLMSSELRFWFPFDRVYAAHLSGVSSKWPSSAMGIRGLFWCSDDGAGTTTILPFTAIHKSHFPRVVLDIQYLCGGRVHYCRSDFRTEYVILVDFNCFKDRTCCKTDNL